MATATNSPKARFLKEKEKKAEITSKLVKRKSIFKSFRTISVLLVVFIAIGLGLFYSKSLLPIRKARFYTGETPEAKKFDRLVNWLIDGGADISPSLRLADNSMDDVRGVYTTATLPYGNRVMRIPLERLLTLEMCKTYPVGKKYEDFVGKPDWIVQLTIVLVEEMRKKDKSKFLPYISILPESLDYFPMFFNEELRKELKGSQVLRTIEGRRKLYKDYFDSVKTADPTWDCTFDHFVYCLLLVNSRNFGIDVHGKHMSTLVPLADMLNHEMPPAPTSWSFNDNLNSFTVDVTKSRGIAAMTAVHDSYGHKCNNRLFAGYGFTLPNNPANTALVNLNANNSDPEFSKKFFSYLDPSGNYYKDQELDSETINRMMAMYGLDGIQLMVGFGEETMKLLSLLRFFSSPIESLKSLGKSDKIQPISLGNELKAIERLIEITQFALDQFPTSIEEDELLIEKYKENFNLKNCVQMRLGEKIVLKWALDFGKEALSYLNDPEKLRSMKFKDSSNQLSIEFYLKRIQKLA